jgi:hypothetical protein
MKDPFNAEPTPYEILGIEPGAAPVVQENAYRRRLAAGVKAVELQTARAWLRDPERMLLVDAFEYDAGVFSRLGLGADDLALTARERTRERLESELRDWINRRGRSADDGAALGHALFVLSYFSGVVRAGAAGADAFGVQIWRRTIGYFAFVRANAQSLPAFQADDPVRPRIEEQLIAREQTGAAGYHELRAMIPIELRAARELRASGLSDGIGFGPLLADNLGFRGALSEVIAAEQRKRPTHEALRFLSGVFHGLAAVYALRERRDFSGALAAIQRMPTAERNRSEVQHARAEISFELGKTLASAVGARNEAQVMDAWEVARNAAGTSALRAEVESEIESYCVRRATELSRFAVDDAAQLLRRARKSADTSKVRAGLLAILRQQVHEVSERNPALAARLTAEASALTGAPTTPASQAQARPESKRPAAPPSPPPLAIARALREGGQPELALRVLEPFASQGPLPHPVKRELAACLAAKAERDVDRLVGEVESDGASDLELWRRLGEGVEQAQRELLRASELDPTNQHAAQTLARLLELRDALRPRAVAPRTPVPGASVRSVQPVAPPAAVAGPYRSTAHILLSLVPLVAAIAVCSWLVRSPEPWLAAFRRETPAFAVLTPLATHYLPYLVWTVIIATGLSSAGLGWLSELAARVLHLLAYPLIVRWQRKGAFGKLVEYAVVASVLSVFLLAAQALVVRFRPAPSAARAAASATTAQVGEPAPARPSPAPSASHERERVARLLGDVSKLDAVTAGPWIAEFEKARPSGSVPVRADQFVLATAFEQRRDVDGAATRYKALAPGRDAYARSARFRLAELRSSGKPLDDALAEFASERGDGWFKTKTAWVASTLEQQVAQRRLDAQSGRMSVRLLSAIRRHAPPPAELAYWFVFGVVALGFKLLQLPFTWKNIENSVRLRLLEPERRALMERYSHDPQARNVALMEFYRKHEVNLFAGCLAGLLELGVVVWALFAMSAYAPQWGLDGARFLWLNDITQWDYRVAGLWLSIQILIAMQGFRNESSEARAQLVATFLLLAGLTAAAYYFRLPACVFIFLTLLALASLVFKSSLTKVHSLRYG